MMQTEWRPESLHSRRRSSSMPRPGHLAGPVRGVMGAEQHVGLRRHRGPAHRGAMGRLFGRWTIVHRRGRGADRRAGASAAIRRRRAITTPAIRSRAGGRGPTPPSNGWTAACYFRSGNWMSALQVRRAADPLPDRSTRNALRFLTADLSPEPIRRPFLRHGPAQAFDPDKVPFRHGQLSVSNHVLS